jgi:uncharacterized Tic20 family protein
MTTDTPDTDHGEEVMEEHDEQAQEEALAADDEEILEAAGMASDEPTPDDGSAGTESAMSEPVPQPVPPAPAAGGMDSKNKAVFAHLSAFLTFVGLPAPIGPLVAWLVLKDQDAYAADQAKEALNFNLSFLLYAIVAGVSLFLLVGFVLLPVVLILWFIFPILAAIAASRGEWYRYPMTIRMIA